MAASIWFGGSDEIDQKVEIVSMSLGSDLLYVSFDSIWVFGRSIQNALAGSEAFLTAARCAGSRPG
jgi:hypothetical protein